MFWFYYYIHFFCLNLHEYGTRTGPDQFSIFDFEFWITILLLSESPTTRIFFTKNTIVTESSTWSSWTQNSRLCFKAGREVAWLAGAGGAWWTVSEPYVAAKVRWSFTGIQPNFMKEEQKIKPKQSPGRGQSLCVPCKHQVRAELGQRETRRSSLASFEAHSFGATLNLGKLCALNHWRLSAYLQSQESQGLKIHTVLSLSCL